MRDGLGAVEKGMVLRWGAVVAVALGAVLPAAVMAQEPVVQPADVATPTATPIFPTPTPTPAMALLVRTQVGHDSTARYVVQAGDTLLTVALETGLDFEDVPCAVAPSFREDQPLVIGDVLSIPPATVACHRVAPGETLADIAAAYRATPEEIYGLAWNQLAVRPFDAVQLLPGSHLRVPLPLAGAVKPNPNAPATVDDTAGSFLPLMLDQPVNTSPFVIFGQHSAESARTSSNMGPMPADWPYGSGRFSWPVYGWLSQSYRFDHRAIDIAAQTGTPITAADRGVVVRRLERSRVWAVCRD
ncbi:MAG: M23 family metallopeptidase [Anaerolineales bacterium]|nr:M23 family metallopeptidase [Anaerolineales bacterium]